MEVSLSRGSGRIQITGRLGETMQESVRTALSYVRANAVELGLNSHRLVVVVVWWLSAIHGERIEELTLVPAETSSRARTSRGRFATPTSTCTSRKEPFPRTGRRRGVRRPPATFSRPPRED